MSSHFETGIYRGFPIVFIRGELDLSSDPDLTAVLSSAVEGAHPCVILDLLDVGYTQASALRAIKVAHRLMHARGAVLAVVCCQAHVDKLVTLIGLHHDLAVFHSLDQAVGFLSEAC